LGKKKERKKRATTEREPQLRHRPRRRRALHRRLVGFEVNERPNREKEKKLDRLAAGAHSSARRSRSAQEKKKKGKEEDVGPGKHQARELPGRSIRVLFAARVKRRIGTGGGKKRGGKEGEFCL